MKNVNFLKHHHKTNHDKLSSKKGYQVAVLVSLTATPPTITIFTNTEKQISSPYSVNKKGFAT